jgi:hypothetical protein
VKMPTAGRSRTSYICAMQCVTNSKMEPICMLRQCVLGAYVQTVGFWVLGRFSNYARQGSMNRELEPPTRQAPVSFLGL